MSHICLTNYLLFLIFLQCLHFFSEAQNSNQKCKIYNHEIKILQSRRWNQEEP